MNGQNTDEIALCNKISLLVNAFTDTHRLSKEAFLAKVLHSAFELIPEAEKGSIYIENNGLYRPICAKGYDMELLSKLFFSADDLFIGFECKEMSEIQSYQNYIARRDDRQFTADNLEIFKQLGTYEHFTTMYAPLLYDHTLIGLISLERFKNEPFTLASQEILRFYAQSISNYYTLKIKHDLEKKLYDETVMALVTAIEIKDSYTVGHARRVMQYSDWIATALQLPTVEVEQIKIAALLHDVGKLGVADEILNKPGKLTIDEYEEIKKHPENSKRILENITDFNEIVSMAYMHHEHFDGSGYPQGLRENEIPIGAHIIQVADAFDAMTSERSYRKALTYMQALEILQNEIGKQFHPEVVTAAVALYKAMKTIEP